MNRLMTPTLYAFCSIVLNLATASASPREASQYLMRTPVSMPMDVFSSERTLSSISGL